jgi:hypothetical protein
MPAQRIRFETLSRIQISRADDRRSRLPLHLQVAGEPANISSALACGARGDFAASIRLDPPQRHSTCEGERPVPLITALAAPGGCRQLVEGQRIAVDLLINIVASICTRSTSSASIFSTVMRTPRTQ